MSQPLGRWKALNQSNEQHSTHTVRAIEFESGDAAPLAAPSHRLAIRSLMLKATAVTAKRVGVALGKCTAVRSAHGNTSVKRWPKHDALGGPNRPPIVDVRPNRRNTRTPWPFVSIEPPSPTLEPLSTPLTWLNLLRVLSATATQEADPLSPPPPRDTIHAHCDTASERSLASCPL